MILFSCLAPCIVPSSVTVPLVRPAGRWGAGPGWAHTGLVVRVESASGPRRFRLSPDAPRSVPFVEGRRFSLAGTPVTVTEVRTPPVRSTLFRADGLLGADWMRDKTLGFDPTTSTLHIWTKGLTKDEAKAWVGEGAEATPLVRLPGGRFAQSVTLGSETRTLALVAPEVPPTLAKAPSGAVDVGDLPRFGSSAGYRGPGRVSFGAGASTRRLDWLLYGTGPLTEVGDGFLPLFEGTSGRVVLDGRGDLFVARPATLDERIAEELFRAVQIPVRASDGEFLIDGTATMRDSDYDSIVGKPIVGIGGVKLSSVLNDWRSGNRRRVFESLVRWRREGFDLSVMRDASKDERVGVPIPPDPLMGGR